MLRLRRWRLFWWAANEFRGDEEVRDLLWSKDVGINGDRNGLYGPGGPGMCSTVLHRAPELLQQPHVYRRSRLTLLTER